MPNKHHFARCVLLLASVVSAPYAMAQQEAQGTTAILLDMEAFSWQEFTPGNIKTWEDSGPRLGIGAAWSNLRTPSGGPVYRGMAKLYGASVDSDDLNAPAATTKTRYLGVQAEGLGGYRFGGKAGLELFSGIGADIWQRNKLDGVSGTGAVKPYDRELWAVLNAKMGAGLFMRFSGWGMALRAGPKLPMATWQRVDRFDGVDLLPKGEVSSFAQAEFNFGPEGKDNLSLVIYYDSYRFKASKFERVTRNGVTVGTLNQPDTDMAVAGIRLSAGF